MRKSARLFDIGGSRPQNRRGRNNPFRYLGVDFHERDVARQHDHGNTTLGDGNTNGALENLRQLARIGDQFDIVATVLEETFRMCGLEIIDADFAARDVGRDRQYGYAVALAIEQAVDQMQIAGTAAAGAHRKTSRKMSLRPGRESRSLLMAHVDPIDRFSSPQ